MLTYKILGPLEVARDGEAVQLGPAKQRALLACLLLNANATVSKDRLIDALWGEAPPDRADQNLFQHVFRLRKILDDGGRAVLVRKDPGYLIRLGGEDVLDAARFEDLLTASGAETGSDQALALLDEALALWRGPALADFAFDDFAQTDAAKLEELHVVAEEARMEALLALERHNDAILELRRLVQRHPIREHLYALLALALYRAGRQAEALAAIQTARQALSAEYGIDIGQELRQLEDAILRQDPELALPRPKPAPVEVRPTPGVAPVGIPTRQERRRHAGRSRRVLGVTAVVVVAGIVVTAAVLASDDEGPPRVAGDTSPTPTAPPLTSLRLDWNEAANEDFLVDGEQRLLGGVDTPSGGFLAYGFSRDEGGDYDTAAWIAKDEQEWKRSISSTFVTEGNGRAAAGWEFEDGSIVILGWVKAEGDFDAAGWTKAPESGSEWLVVPHQDLAFGGREEDVDQQIRDAVLGDQKTMIAVGFTSKASDVDPDGFGDEPAVWEGAAAGTRWTFPQGAVTPTPGDQQIITVAYNASSTPHLTVAGGYSEQDGDRDAAVWLYRRNRLKRLPAQADLEGEGDQQINELTSYGEGFIAVGEETSGGDTDAVIWSSSNGKTWKRVLVSGDVLGGIGDQRIYTVASSEVGLVAAGREDYTGADGRKERDAAVWTSVGGVNWIRLRGDDPTMTALTDQGFEEIKGLIRLENGFLALGAAGPTEDKAKLDACVWIGTLISDD